MLNPPREHRAGSRLVRPIVGWTLGCILLTGCAGPQPADAPGDGQVAQAPSEQQAAPPAQGTRALTVLNRPEEIDRGCEKEDRSAGAVTASIPAGKHPAADPADAEGPGPRWTCAAQNITLEPVWQGQPLEYNFTIRNPGQAILTVRLRKG